MDYKLINSEVEKFVIHLGTLLIKRSKMNNLKKNNIFEYYINGTNTLKFHNKLFIVNDSIKWNLLNFIDYHKIFNKSIVYSIKDPNLDIMDLLVISKLFSTPKISQYITNSQDEIVKLGPIKIIIGDDITNNSFSIYLLRLNYDIIVSHNNMFIIRAGLTDIGLLVHFDKLKNNKHIRSLFISVNYKFIEYHNIEHGKKEGETVNDSLF